MKDLHRQNKNSFFHFLLTASLLLMSIPIKAQTLSVDNFRILENDLTANTQGTMMTDQNGEVAALIKVVTTATGFVFDGGMMGIVNTVQKTGEIWVYVPRGLQRITISHQQFGVLRDYYFPIPIEKARTYELKLTSGTVRTIVEQNVTSQYVVFKVKPTNATVFIDDEEPHALDSDGALSIRLKHGTHTYRVAAASYLSESGVIEVQSEKIVKEIFLQSSKAILTVNTSPDAEIWINDIQKGIGNWTGELEAGVYLVESRKQSHISIKQEITLEQQETRSISLDEPVPVYGVLDVQSSPIESDVYIDDQLVGQTPLIIERFLVGEHNIRVQKPGYNTIVQTINIEEGSQYSHKYSLIPTGNESVTSDSFEEIEPVMVAETSQIAETPKKPEPQVEPEYVDLGLSVKWATFNVGASKPEDYGGYYAWGETVQKSHFYWNTYKWCAGASSTITKYNSLFTYGKNGYVDNLKVLQPDDDVAHVQWGGDWRMPTVEECRELLKKCNWELTKRNGIPGYLVTGRKADYKKNSIFLPLAGVREGHNTNHIGIMGIYRSSSIERSDPNMAQDLFFNSSYNRFIGTDYRFGGLTVRPVHP